MRTAPRQRAAWLPSLSRPGRGAHRYAAIPSLALLEGDPGPLTVAILVIAEVAYLVATRLGVETEDRFLGALMPAR